MNSYSFGKSLIQTNDGGYLIAGDTCGVLNEILLIRTNNMGDTLWTKDNTRPNWLNFADHFSKEQWIIYSER
ncbi:MAG: hypothetical protein IPQ03_08520 [Bacteroidetes bacterium]|nr:hypothetical protein [Bacteroidota bacterium]